MIAEFPVPPARSTGSDFARLSKKITDSGLMNRRPGYYTARVTGVATLYAGGLAAFVLIGASWWTLAVAAVLAIAFGQVALVAHDIAHRQVFRRRRASEASGRIHVAGVRALANPSLRNRPAEGILLFGHFACYLTALFLMLPPGMAVAFLAVHQCLFGLYLGSVFAPNHKGMPVLTGKDRPDFLRRQILTSRNVRGGRLTDVVLGGLNHQIEHHLFPSMPSPNLRKAQIIVRRHCEELGIAYLETGLAVSYRQALRSLHHAGAPLRRTKAAA
ncbi:fatty acid desaturase family protein [Streptomyces sp. NPDC057616]|uniref:fatty acid desaturase family protein n=1 Tax=Streptomyces sp. NPDC057616 TaxID=3346183 RepID=UPI0036839EE4